MRRRTFITLLGGAAAAWPLAARAQQQPRAPTIGFLHSASADGSADRVRPFRQGLKEAGLIEGENVTVEYRWAAQEVERRPAMILRTPGPRRSSRRTESPAMAWRCFRPERHWTIHHRALGAPRARPPRCQIRLSIRDYTKTLAARRAC